MLREHYVKTNSPFPRISKYRLLTAFEGRTVSYGPRVSFSFYGPNAKCAEGHKSKRKNEDPELTIRTDKTRLVR